MKLLVILFIITYSIAVYGQIKVKTLVDEIEASGGVKIHNGSI